MQIFVTVRNRSHERYPLLLNQRTLSVQIDLPASGCVVDDLAKLLSNKISIPQQSLRFILSGRILSGATTLESLSLGPQTSLAALVVDVTPVADAAPASASAPSSLSNDSLVAKPDETPDDSVVSSFYVFCKKCGSLRRGKLRVYCSVCSSSAILLKRDPQQWSDVLSVRTIQGDCGNCEAETFAKFCFKCVRCDEVGAPLVHVRRYRGEGDCCICGETSMKAVVDVGCHHQTCLECFVAYMDMSFRQHQFIARHPHGYTLSCPVYGCRGCVTDAHLFYLLGSERYAEYQREATERFVALENEGVFCPYSNCGAAFLWDRADTSTTTNNMIQCAECRRLFCAECHRERCICAEEEEASQLTIRSTCRPCPQCGVATERNGGCAHIHCVNCDTHWCFICGKLWSEQCQWDHWFD